MRRYIWRASKRVSLLISIRATVVLPIIADKYISIDRFCQVSKSVMKSQKSCNLVKRILQDFGIISVFLEDPPVLKKIQDDFLMQI